MNTCVVSPEDKKHQAKIIGEDLISHYGKKKFYSVEEVKAANKRCDIPIDLACWSHALFNSHEDFDVYHQSMGEACDYAAMKQEMVAAISRDSVEATNWLDIDLSWLDFPEIDFSIFDFIDF
jgi:hypothetical protein